MCDVASAHGGTVIDDIVPGHTGKGADFRLAEMKYWDYPGIYHMVEIPEHDWHLLPKVPRGRDSINLDYETEDLLSKSGYIVGKLQRVIFADPGIKDTNWSATAPVVGLDQQVRRWVYLHYFKEGQPSINWLDPTLAGMRLVIGDALHSLGDLGSGALRLDANGFLGVEKSAEGAPAGQKGTRCGGREPADRQPGPQGRRLHLPGAQPHDRRHQEHLGARRRPVVRLRHSPRLSPRDGDGDTEFLRLTLRLAQRAGVEAACLVHALQNHDEMTYELVHSRHCTRLTCSTSAGGT